MGDTALGQGAPLRVLHSCPVWLPQTQTWLYQQVRALPPEIESHIACLRTEHGDQFPHPRIAALCGSMPAYRFEALLRRLGLPRYPRWLERQGRRLQADVLHSHFGNMGWQDLRVAQHLRIPQVVTFYGLDVDYLPQQDRRWQQRYGELFAAARVILCEGPHMAARIVARGCPEHKVRVHHLGVDVRAISCQPRQWISGEPLRVLIAGAFREKKGIPAALEALARLPADLPLEITLIGDAGDEPRGQQEKQRILDVMARHRLNVRLMGFQPHAVLFDEAYRHHVFLSPSQHAADGDSEGGAPVSIIEMAATGMPVVSTTHCDIPNLLRDGVSGLLAPERDVAGLTDRLLWLAEHPQAWQPMTLAARRHIEAEFDMAQQGERLAAIYRDLVAGHG